MNERDEVSDHAWANLGRMRIRLLLLAAEILFRIFGLSFFSSLIASINWAKLNEWVDELKIGQVRLIKLRDEENFSHWILDSIPSVDLVYLKFKQQCINY